MLFKMKFVTNATYSKNLGNCPLIGCRSGNLAASYVTDTSSFVHVGRKCNACGLSGMKFQK